MELPPFAESEARLKLRAALEQLFL
jgi:hypothetical protein